MHLYLHGAKKNAGDFLIRQRGLEVLREPAGRPLVEDQPRWEPIEALHSWDSVVFGGGPALRRDFPSVYADRAATLMASNTPLTALALGRDGAPWTGPLRGFFTPGSIPLLSRLAEGPGGISVRDVLTEQLITEAGFPCTMTGCVAWYDIPKIAQGLRLPSSVDRIAFSPPALQGNWRQAHQLLRALSARFPAAEKLCLFHRGIRPDPRTGKREGLRNILTAGVALKHGFRVRDIAYGTKGLREYARCDLHVGYRVHAHIFCLAARRPSFLIEEDSRGSGQAETLHPELRLPAERPDLVGHAMERVESELSRTTSHLTGAVGVMRGTWETMRGFVHDRFAWSAEPD